MPRISILRGFRRSLKRSRVNSAVLQALRYVDMHLYNSEELAKIIEEVAMSIGVDYNRKYVTTHPKGHDIGHIHSPNKSVHAVVEILGHVYDPYLLPKTLPLNDYLKHTFSPQEGVVLKVLSTLEM